MKRRDFFKVLLLSSAGLAAPYYLPGLFKKSNYLLQPYENRHTGECGIFAFNFAEGTYRKALTNFNVHNIFYDQDRREFIGINKYGLQFLKFKTIQFDGLEHHVLPTPSYSLSGHVASVPGAEHYYLIASNSLTGKTFWRSALSTWIQTSFAKLIKILKASRKTGKPWRILLQRLGQMKVLCL